MKCVNSQAILKYGIRMAFTHETKPKMKKRRPIINIEMIVSFFVNEPMSTEAVSVLLMKLKVIFSLSLKLYFQKAAPQMTDPKRGCNLGAIEECWPDKDY